MFDAPILDPRRLCRLGETVEGHCLPADLSALQGELHNPDGVVQYRVVGSLSADQQPLLSVYITGQVQLTCQRCLEAMRFDLDLCTHLVLVPDEAALPALEEEQAGWDVIVCPTQLVVADLIQEEIVLALPVAPTHAQGPCGASTVLAAEPAAHPFAALRSLT